MSIALIGRKGTTYWSDGGGPVILELAYEPAPRPLIHVAVQPDLVEALQVQRWRAEEHPGDDIEDPRRRVVLRRNIYVRAAIRLDPRPLRPMVVSHAVGGYTEQIRMLLDAMYTKIRTDVRYI